MTPPHLRAAVPFPCLGSAAHTLGSSCITRGLRVEVQPRYIPDESDPGAGRFTFGYRVRISNESGPVATLHSRHWVIVDADGERHEVRGEGVVGRNPTLSPGQSFEYASFCPLPTPWGTMEGTYLFVTEAGERFEVTVARFYLVRPHDA